MGSLFDLALRLTCDLSSAIQGKCDFSDSNASFGLPVHEGFGEFFDVRSEFDGGDVSQGCEEIWTEDLHVLPV